MDGSAAIVRIDGQLTIKYEFRSTIEVVIEGQGRVIQFADITSEKLSSELN